jgi:hypothetical protein
MAKLTEGLQKDDLVGMIRSYVSIDEFRSKMGNDEDVVVLAFFLKQKDPATDLMNFIEKGYDFVLDADISTGELNDHYLTFVEMTREKDVNKHILKVIMDLKNLTGYLLSDWDFSYKGMLKKYELSMDNLMEMVPETPEKYKDRYNRDSDMMLENMLATARVNIVKRPAVYSRAKR